MTQLEHKKPILKRVRRVVVKIGSQILSSQDGIEEARLRGLVRQLAELHEGKRQVVVVSSGAVAAGMTQLGWKERVLEAEAGGHRFRGELKEDGQYISRSE